MLALASFSNAAIAAPTSLSTAGSWQTATGDLSSLVGQPAPATWNYDTDLSTATILGSAGLPSGAIFTGYSSPNYSLSGTAAPGIFDGNPFAINIIDNTIAAIDALDSPDLIASMLNEGLNPNATGDVVVFATSTEVSPVESFDLFGLMIFDEDFFSGPIATLPTAEVLLENALFTYATLTHSFNFGQGIIETGFASYAQSPSAVPVPAAAFMFAPALLGFLGMRRKAKNSAV